MDAEKKGIIKNLLTEAAIGAVLMVFDYFVDGWFLDGIPGAAGILMILFSLFGFWKLFRKPEPSEVNSEPSRLKPEPDEAEKKDTASGQMKEKDTASGQMKEKDTASGQMKEKDTASGQTEEKDTASGQKETAPVPETGREQ